MKNNFLKYLTRSFARPITKRGNASESFGYIMIGCASESASLNTPKKSWAPVWPLPRAYQVQKQLGSPVTSPGFSMCLENWRKDMSPKSVAFSAAMKRTGGLLTAAVATWFIAKAVGLIWRRFVWCVTRTGRLLLIIWIRIWIFEFKPLNVISFCFQ